MKGNSRLLVVLGIFTSVIASIATLVNWYNECQECIDMYKVELAFFSVTLVVIISLGLMVYFYLQGLARDWLLSEIDRVHYRLKDAKFLTAEEAKHVLHLEERRKKLRQNSFNERKLAHLIAKEIRD